MPRPSELTEPDLPSIEVVVGILRDGDNRVLIGRRLPGKHMAGAWEFPGGKREAGESPLAALRRELAEETSVVVERAERLLAHKFAYPDRVVRLDVWWVLEWRGPVVAAEGQDLKWVAIDQLETEAMLPADAPLVAAVRRRLM